MAKSYFTRRGDKIEGPLTKTIIEDRVREGELIATDNVAPKKTGPWHQVENVPALAKLLPDLNKASKFFFADNTEPEDTKPESTKSAITKEIDSQDGLFGAITSVTGQLSELSEMKNSRPSRLSGIAVFGKRVSYAIRLIFHEKELFVFAMLQWASIAIVYFIWAQVIGLFPEDMWAEEGSEEITTGEIILIVWSLTCLALATFPLGVMSGCMGAVHFLHRQGERSTIAACLKIVMPNALKLWGFHFLDGLITCKQIVERLSSKGENEDAARARARRARSEAFYYAWKLGSIGIMPSLVLGKGFYKSCQESVGLVKNRFLDVALLRAGYSAICWIVTILILVLGYLFLSQFYTLMYGDTPRKQDLNPLMFAGIPIMIITGVIHLFIRPIFIISLCDIYSGYLEERGEKIEFSNMPGRGTEALVAFAVLVILVIGALLFRDQLGITALLAT